MTSLRKHALFFTCLGLMFCAELFLIRFNVTTHDSASWSLPLLVDFAQSLKTNQMNLWDFYDLGGVPLLGAHIQNQTFSLVYLVPAYLLAHTKLSVIYISQIIRILKIAVGIGCTYLAIERNIKTNSTRALLVLLLFFSSLNINSLAQPGVMDSYYLLPLFIYIILYVDPKSKTYGLSLGLIITQSLFSYFAIPYLLVLTIFFTQRLIQTNFKFKNTIGLCFGTWFNGIVLVIAILVTGLLQLSIFDYQYVSPLRLHNLNLGFFGGPQFTPLITKDFVQSSSFLSANEVAQTGSFINLHNFLQIASSLPLNGGGETWIFVSLVGVSMFLMGLAKCNLARFDDKFFMILLVVSFFVIFGMNTVFYRFIRYLFPPFFVLRHTELLQNMFLLPFFYFCSKADLINTNSLFLRSHVKQIATVTFTFAILLLMFRTNLVLHDNIDRLTACIILTFLCAGIVLAKRLPIYKSFFLPVVIFLLYCYRYDGTDNFSQQTILLNSVILVVFLWYVSSLFKTDTVLIIFSIVFSLLVPEKITLLGILFVFIPTLLFLWALTMSGNKIKSGLIFFVLITQLGVYNGLKYFESWMSNKCVMRDHENRAQSLYGVKSNDGCLVNETPIQSIYYDDWRAIYAPIRYYGLINHKTSLFSQSCLFPYNIATNGIDNCYYPLFISSEYASLIRESNKSKAKANASFEFDQFYYGLRQFKVTPNNLEVKLHADSDGLIRVPFNKDKNLFVAVNGIKQDFSDGTFLALELKRGLNEVRITYSNFDFLGLYLVLVFLLVFFTTKQIIHEKIKINSN